MLQLKGLKYKYALSQVCSIVGELQKLTVPIYSAPQPSTLSDSNGGTQTWVPGELVK